MQNTLYLYTFIFKLIFDWISIYFLIWWINLAIVFNRLLGNGNSYGLLKTNLICTCHNFKSLRHIERDWLDCWYQAYFKFAYSSCLLYIYTRILIFTMFHGISSKYTLSNSLSETELCHLNCAHIISIFFLLVVVFFSHDSISVRI